MNKLLVAIALVCSFSAASAAEKKIAVLDKNAALFNSEAAQEINDQMRKDFGSKEQLASKLEAEIAKIRENYKTDKDILTEDEVNKLNQSLQSKQQELNAVAQEMQMINQSVQQQFIQQFQPVLGKAVDVIVAKNKYDLILDAQAVIYVGDTEDITQLVLTEFNKQVAQLRTDGKK